MSEFVGIASRTGAPLDPGLVEAVRAGLQACAVGAAPTVVASRGPLHALVRVEPGARGDSTGVEGPGTAPPVVASARLDGRAELVEALRAAGAAVQAGAADEVLVAAAWAAWGEACRGRLLGDFAFLAWDEARSTLFGAGDPLGVRRLYHAATPSAVLVASSIRALLAVPGISHALDPRFVGDFLLFAACEDPGWTAYAAIAALPPAHTLTAGPAGVRIARYWELEEGPELRYRRVGDYVEHFGALFRQAVRDRLPDGPVSVQLSGGVDSTAVAAEAVAALGAGAVRGFTVAHAPLLPDREPFYARLAADALGIGLEVLEAAPYAMFEAWDVLAAEMPEPLARPLWALERDLGRAGARHAPVVLTGLGGDATLAESRSRLLRLAAGGHPLRALAEAIAFTRVHGRIPRPGFRSWLRDRGGPHVALPPYPPWLAPDFTRAMGLRERWAEAGATPYDAGRRRPEVYARALSPGWLPILANLDPARSGFAAEARHPLMDLRLVRFLLSVPPAQWYNDKALLRLWMRGRLPPAIVRRRKTPLVGDPMDARRRAFGDAWLGGRRLGAAVEEYVDPARVPAWAGGGDRQAPDHAAWLHVRPLALSLWMEVNLR
jgi:asparagine synthase (glutamine-hydrolysing)